MNENEKQLDGQNEQLPEDFRPVIPEPEVRRRSIIGFSRDYPVAESPTSTHTKSFAQEEQEKKIAKGVLYAIILILVFIFTYIITAVCINISTESLPPTTAYIPKTTVTQTEPQPTSAPEADTTLSAPSPTE